MTAELVLAAWVKGKLLEKRIRVPAGWGVLVGRSPMAEVRLAGDPYVSNGHALILFDGRCFLIQDLGSTNGTFVNRKQISSPRPLRPGDEIWVGKTRIMVAEIRLPLPGSLPQPAAPKPAAVGQSAPLQPAAGSIQIGTWWNVAKMGPLPAIPLDLDAIWYSSSSWPKGWEVLVPLTPGGPLTPSEFRMKWDGYGWVAQASF